MKKIILRVLLLFGCILVLSIVIFGQRMTKDASPCEAIKGKSYIGWQTGTFEGNPDTVNSFRIDFDSKAIGKTREFFTMYLGVKADQEIRTNITCNINQTKGDKYFGKAYFNTGASTGIVYFTAYDSGSKIWMEVPMENRKTKGWMLQLPANPPASENIVK